MTPEQDIPSVQSAITTLPPELFIKLCAFLPPADLFTLSQVCRKFHGYLCAPNSFSTQQIWKVSRLKFMLKEDMPPPEGMNEKKYVELLMMERGCQICKRVKLCKIYWEFEVRSCEECFLIKAVNLSKENLKSWLDDKKLIFDSIMEYATQRAIKYGTLENGKYY
ncbi:hypothetical protein C1645_730881 [Glomus cerebriforme]|uniref:F-box domain-containing protein n=1 Tax=Glomus cerebriforme TaxID=658196 RepID=A0A397TPQ7_9GLOM|nr:hypothetical protein C1645_730881 [Glomus cerebriforme]